MMSTGQSWPTLETSMLFNVYFPNGKASKERLDYKLEFYDRFLDHMDQLLKAGRNIVICGDVNTAHKEIDLARPKPNEKISGFLPVERAWIDRLVEHGFLDTFRLFHPEGGNYSFWDIKTGARERNVGWRIDYFFVSESLRDRIQSAFILKDVMGADHCPVGIELRSRANQIFVPVSPTASETTEKSVTDSSHSEQPDIASEIVQTSISPEFLIFSKCRSFEIKTALVLMLVAAWRTSAYCPSGKNG